MSGELFSNLRNSKVVFKLKGFYFAQPNFDWRPKLVQLFDPSVGYYFDSEKTDATLSCPTDANIVYDIIIASPTEDSLFIIEDVMEHLKDSPKSTVFTYLNEYGGNMYDENQIAYLNKIGDMVNNAGGIFFTTKSLDMLAGCINMLAYQKIKELKDIVCTTKEEAPIVVNALHKLNATVSDNDMIALYQDSNTMGTEVPEQWESTENCTETFSSEECPTLNPLPEEEK